MFQLKVDSVLGQLFPRQCVLCCQASGSSNCCAGCRQDLPWLRHPCQQCGAPLPDHYCGTSCARCAISTAATDRVISALIYEYPVDRLIMRAKFQARPDSARALGELLSLYLSEYGAAHSIDLPDLLLPVPLHRVRLARRGFNQALEIAAPVADVLGIPLATDACRRIRDTAEQTTLTGRARQGNMTDAFRATLDLSGRRIALIDDVITTGSTADAMATALRKAGAVEIQVWSVARTITKY